MHALGVIFGFVAREHRANRQLAVATTHCRCCKLSEYVCIHLTRAASSKLYKCSPLH